MTVTISRKVHFNAAHRLHNKYWTDQRNLEVFGVCNNANYHGHNYDLIVSVTGEIDPESGYVVDAKHLKQIIREKVIVRFDHKNLNLDTAEFSELNPTAENMAVVIHRLLTPHIGGDKKLKITLYETERNFVEYSGE